MATSTSTRPTTRQSARFSRTTKPAKRVVEEVSDSEEERERQREVAEKSSSKAMRTPTKKRRTSSSGNYEQDDGNASQKSQVQITVTPVKEAPTLAYPNYLPTPPITPTTSSASSNSTPSSSSSSSSGSTSNVYARARALLRLSAHEQQSSTSCELVGRNVERSQLEAFLKTNLPDLYTSAELEDVASSCSSKALYVSGSPGTGKTALLQNILGRLNPCLDASTSLAFLNCTTIQRSDDIWERLAEELGFTADGKGKKRCNNLHGNY